MRATLAGAAGLIIGLVVGVLVGVALPEPEPEPILFQPGGKARARASRRADPLPEP